MASATIGALRVTLGLNTAAFENGLTAAQKQLAKTGRQLKKTGAKMQSIGKNMSIGVTAPMVAMGVKSLEAANNLSAAQAQVQAGLDSMGDASGKTAGELQKTARALQGLSEFDDSEILSKVTANMLTFGNIAGTQFDRAQQAALDLSTRLDQDLKSSAILVGKALNDPATGLSTLSRVGITFSEDMKDTIKSMQAMGDTAGAQNLILAELERQFGGSAKAARDSAPGSDTVDAWRDLQDTLGNMIRDILPPITDALTKMLGAFNSLSPGMQTFVAGSAVAAAALGPLIGVLGTVVRTIGWALPLIGKLGPAFIAMKAAVVPALLAIGKTIMTLIIATGPLGLIIAAVTAAVAIWYNWDKIEPVVRRVYEAVKAWLVDKLAPVWNAVKSVVSGVVTFVSGLITGWVDLHVNAGRAIARTVKAMYQAVKTWLADKLGGVMDSVTDKIQWVADKFKWLDDVVVRNSYVPDMVDSIGQHFARLQGNMVDPAIAANDNVAQSFESMATRGVNALQSLIGAIKSGDIGGIIQSGLGILGSLGIGGKSGGGKIDFGSVSASSLIGFKNGGSFNVGGKSGVDKNIVAFRASKGERVDISTRGQQQAGGGLVRIMLDSALLKAEVVEGAVQVFSAGAPGVVQVSTANTFQQGRRRRLTQLGTG